MHLKFGCGHAPCFCQGLITEGFADPKIWLGLDVVYQKLKFSEGEKTLFKSIEEDSDGAFWMKPHVASGLTGMRIVNEHPIRRFLQGKEYDFHFSPVN